MKKKYQGLLISSLSLSTLMFVLIRIKVVNEYKEYMKHPEMSAPFNVYFISYHPWVCMFLIIGLALSIWSLLKYLKNR